MATYYVYHAAGGGGTGANWANAYATLTLAFSGHAAGDTYYVAHDHAESTASTVTLTPLGTLAAPTNVICVNRAGTVPPVSADLRTTATVSTTGSNSNIIIAPTAYYYGIKFQAGSSTTAANLQILNASNGYLRFESCGLACNNTNSGSRITFGSTTSNIGNEVQFLNCTFTFGSNTSQSMTGVSGGNVTILGGSFVVGANIPTTLITTAMSNMRFIGVDLSVFGSGKTLVGGSTNNCMVLLQDCKLGASVTVAATPTSAQQVVYVVRSDSGDTNYRQEKYDYTGTLTTETTIIRTGGASDGTTGISWKIVTSANSKFVQPFDCMPRIIWNETTGSRTITIYGVWGGGAVPLNDEIWFDLAYLGTSGFPRAVIGTTTKADILATGSNTTSDSSTWGGSTTKFKMTTTVTINEKGPLMVIVKAAKVSSTFYIDPEIELT